MRQSIAHARRLDTVVATFRKYRGTGELWSEREESVLELRLEKLKTLEEVARQFSVTRERIRQVESEALRKLWARVSEVVGRHVEDRSYE